MRFGAFLLAAQFPGQDHTTVLESTVAAAVAAEEAGFDDVWVAEVESSYELRDWLQLNGLPRAYVVHEGPDGIREVHAYGAHERPLTEHRTGEEGTWLGGRWIPPL